MAVTDAKLEELFDAQFATAQELLTGATDNVNKAFETFTDKSAFRYEPYQWQTPSAPIIVYNPSFTTPGKPGRPSDPKTPTLKVYPKDLANPNFGTAPTFLSLPPQITFPPEPGGEPTDFTGGGPVLHTPVFPGGPTLLALPPSTLPYPTVTIPTKPDIVMPVFSGTQPDGIHQISLQEYLDKLTDTYATYAQDIPALVKSNWLTWFRALLDERPLIDRLADTITSYMTTGGAGIPVPIEEAIVTRATDRVASEQRRATLHVYDEAVKHGLLLPSGALLAGLKEARQLSAEAVSKVATDVAIKNLELEHDHMKFMLKLGSELEQWVAGFAVSIAKIVLDANAQAIEVTKLILTGMIEINNTIVRIYLAKWEAYKAAVEVYKAQIQAIEARTRLYEAEIRAELAKTEVNKAVVEVLQAISGVNRTIAEVFKIQVDAETAKIEADRVAVMAFEAQVRAYGVRVEAWRAKWQGYTARIEGEVAKSKVYESEASAFRARVEGYKATIEGYSELVKGQAVQIDATARENEGQLKAWQIQLDGVLRAYSTDLDAYGKQWAAIGEQLRGYATGAQIVADFLNKQYTTQTTIDIEKQHEHLAEWRAQLEATLKAAQGLTEVSSVAGNLAGSALNGMTSFAGGLATTTE